MKVQKTLTIFFTLVFILISCRNRTSGNAIAQAVNNDNIKCSYRMEVASQAGATLQSSEFNDIAAAFAKNIELENDGKLFAFDNSKVIFRKSYIRDAAKDDQAIRISFTLSELRDDKVRNYSESVIPIDSKGDFWLYLGVEDSTDEDEVVTKVLVRCEIK